MVTADGAVDRGAQLGTWHKHAQAVIRGRHGHAMHAVHGKPNCFIVIWGGNCEVFDDVVECEVRADLEAQWRPLEPANSPPWPRAGCASASIVVPDRKHGERQLIVLFGGVRELPAHDELAPELAVLDVTQKRWIDAEGVSADADVPAPRVGATLTAVGDGRAVLFGGMLQSGAFTNSVHLLSWNAGKQSFSWTSLGVRMTGSPPAPRADHTAVLASSGHMIVYGGRNATGRYDDVHVFDPVSLHWSAPTVSGDVPRGRSMHAAAVLGGHMLDQFLLDLTSFKWQPVALTDEAPKRRAGHAIVTLGSRAVLYGGREGYVYRPLQLRCYRDLWVLEPAAEFVPVVVRAPSTPPAPKHAHPAAPATPSSQQHPSRPRAPLQSAEQPPPQQPIDLTIKRLTGDSALLRWALPTGATPVDYYVVQARLKPGSDVVEPQPTEDVGEAHSARPAEATTDKGAAHIDSADAAASDTPAAAAAPSREGASAATETAADGGTVNAEVTASASGTMAEPGKIEERAKDEAADAASAPSDDVIRVEIDSPSERVRSALPAGDAATAPAASEGMPSASSASQAPVLSADVAQRHLNAYVPLGSVSAATEARVVEMLAGRQYFFRVFAVTGSQASIVSTPLSLHSWQDEGTPLRPNAPKRPPPPSDSPSATKRARTGPALTATPSPSKKAAASAPARIMDAPIGTQIEVKDSIDGQWYYARIVKKHDKRGLYVHFEGWSKMFDEWIPETAAPTRMRHVTQTALYGPHGPEDKWAVCSVDDSMRP